MSEPHAVIPPPSHTVCGSEEEKIEFLLEQVRGGGGASGGPTREEARQVLQDNKGVIVLALGQLQSRYLPTQEERDIELVRWQVCVQLRTNCTREQAIEGLRVADGDICNAIMHLVATLPSYGVYGSK